MRKTSEDPGAPGIKKDTPSKAVTLPVSGLAPSPEAEALQMELETVRKEKEELFSRLQYLQADFENFRKRTARETEATLKFAHEVLVAHLLPVLDDFDAALGSLEGETAKGIRMVHDNLVKALGDAGLQEIPAAGQTFDPYVHECVQQVPDGELPDGAVKEVVRKGYRFLDHVLRPAQVIVVKNGGESNG
ncbi:MAG TPA: nucleotide exchange factor GrpE [Thermoplasmata archaeon]